MSAQFGFVGCFPTLFAFRYRRRGRAGYGGRRGCWRGCWRLQQAVLRCVGAQLSISRTQLLGSQFVDPFSRKVWMGLREEERSYSDTQEENRSASFFYFEVSLKFELSSKNICVFGVLPQTINGSVRTDRSRDTCSFD